MPLCEPFGTAWRRTRERFSHAAQFVRQRLRRRRVNPAPPSPSAVPAAPPPSPAPNGKHSNWSWKPGEWKANRKLSKAQLETTDKRVRFAGQAWTIQSKDARPVTPGPRRLRRPGTASCQRTAEELQAEKERSLKKKQENMRKLADDIRAKNKKASVAFKDRAALQESEKIKKASNTVQQKQVRFEERQRQLLEEKRRKRKEMEAKRDKVIERKAKMTRHLEVSESSSEELVGAVGGHSPSPPPARRRMLPARLPKMQYIPSLPAVNTSSSDDSELENPAYLTTVTRELKADTEDTSFVDRPSTSTGRTATVSKKGKGQGKKSKPSQNTLPDVETIDSSRKPAALEANATSVSAAQPEAEIAPAVKAYLIKVRESEVRVDNVGPRVIQVEESDVKLDTTNSQGATAYGERLYRLAVRTHFYLFHYQTQEAISLCFKCKKMSTGPTLPLPTPMTGLIG
ncbi:MAP7 domain-containing protein 1-like [Lingula anatina]|uniref:MAP7 domain-containing protein 1-like n=1 Tax=Lingula anatina TaxID=7574 RepID=A0A1S3JZN4_LINAN|nr:MAP7 domain-containing protein 1-like [Lingula anatina]|eukprot:XP_013415496.1 MAP7 domain-containing protein 1-like [Lingula anatina]